MNKIIEILKIFILWNVVMITFFYSTNKLIGLDGPIGFFLGAAFFLGVFYPDIKKGRGYRSLEEEQKALERLQCI